MLTKQQKQWRKSGIGGSDVAAILGLSQKWKTAMQVYLEKIGESVDQEENAAMFWGNAQEDKIIQRYAQKYNVEVIKFEGAKPLSHPLYDFFLGSYDGIIINNEKQWQYGLEIKTSRYDDNWGTQGTDEIPDYYLAQVHHYLTIEHARSGITRWDVAVLIGGNEERYYTVNYNQALSNYLIEKCSEFWKCVQNRTPPVIQKASDWSLRYKALSDVSIEADSYILKKLQRLYEISSTTKNLEDEGDKLKAEVMEFMQDNKCICKDGIKLGTIINAEYPKWDNEALNQDADLVQKYKTGVTKKVYFNFSRATQIKQILGV